MHESFQILSYALTYKKIVEKNLLPIQNKYNLRKIDAQILYYLYHFESIDTAKDIIELKIFTKSHVSQSISRLEKKGFVTQIRDKDDKRYIHLHITDKATDIVADVDAVINKMDNIVFQKMTSDEKKQLKSLLEKIEYNMDKAL